MKRWIYWYVIGCINVIWIYVSGKRLIRGSDGVTLADEEMIRAGQDF